MGDEEGQSSSDDSTQSYDTGSTATDYSSTTDPSAADGSQDTGGQSGASPLESLFQQAGEAYSSGDYGTAVALGKQILDQTMEGTDAWGRAAYGLVMSYDMNNQLADATSLMEKVYNHAVEHHPDPSGYKQQFETYKAGHHWQGDYLLW